MRSGHRVGDPALPRAATLPPLDVPVTSGDLGWHYHTGPHAATPADWQAFLVFLDKYFPIPKEPKDAKESKESKEL